MTIRIVRTPDGGNKSGINLRKRLAVQVCKRSSTTIVLAFLTFDEICSTSVSSESMMIPRSVSSKTCSNSWFQILYRSVCLILLNFPRVNTWHFSGWNFRSHLSDPFSSSRKSSWRDLASSFLVIARYIFASSANSRP